MKYFEGMVGATSSPETKQLTAALAKAQAAFPVIAYDRTNEHLRSKYATFQGCCEALRGPLVENGFALPHYQPCKIDGEYVLVGVLRHSSGEFVTGISPLLNHPQQRVDRKTGEVLEVPAGMQGFGAALTYAKRQLLLCLTGAWVGEADDDGAELQQRQGPASVFAGSNPESRAASMVAGMEIEARGRSAIQKSKDDGDRVLAFVKLQVHQGKVSKSVYERLAAEYTNKWGSQE